MGTEITKAITTSFLFVVCFIANAQIPAGDRILGMHTSAAENDDFEAAFAINAGACVKATHLFTPWAWLEDAPGAFNGESVQYLDIANIYYPTIDYKVELNIAVTNTVTREVPSALANLEWDDALMVSNFNVLLDSVFAHIPNLELVALMIGNESDVMWGADVEEVTHFKNFLEQVKVHAEEVYFELHGTNLDVGTTLTFGGAISSATASIYHELNTVTDVISITYYHTGNGFAVLPPEAVSANWSLLDATYSDMEKPIYIVECGCPSANLLGGSEAHQAQFISEVFNAWDQQYSRIKLVFFFMLHDWSQATVDDLAVYYNLEGVEQFTEFLRTLGLRTWPGAGTDKLSLERLRCEADARGFCDAVCTIGVTDSELSAEIIYPNPFSDHIIMSEAIGSIYSILDITGKTLLTGSVRSFSQRIDVSHLASGCYLLTVNGKQIRMVKN